MENQRLNTINSRVFKINTLSRRGDNFKDILNENRISKKIEKNRFSIRSREGTSNELKSSNVTTNNNFNKPSYLLLNIKPETSEEDPVLDSIRNDHQFNQNDESLNTGTKVIKKKIINRKRMLISLSLIIIALIIIFVIIMLSVAFGGKLI